MMRVQVRFFAALRERFGESQVSMEVSQGATVDDLWREVRRQHSALAHLQLRLLYAVNEEYVAGNHTLKDGDEVAFIPPVSGGSAYVPSDG